MKRPKSGSPTTVTFCGHDDCKRRRSAPVSLMEGAEFALFCAPCGVAQQQAAQAFQEGATLKRRKARRTDGAQARGTCEMCHSFDDVSVATQPDGPDALRWKRLCASCNTSVTRPKTKQAVSDDMVRLAGGTYVCLDLRTLNDHDSWRRVFPNNYALLVTDVPWENVAGNAINRRTNKYASISNSDLLRMVRYPLCGSHS